MKIAVVGSRQFINKDFVKWNLKTTLTILNLDDNGILVLVRYK